MNVVTSRSPGDGSVSCLVRFNHNALVRIFPSGEVIIRLPHVKTTIHIDPNGHIKSSVDEPVMP